MRSVRPTCGSIGRRPPNPDSGGDAPAKTGRNFTAWMTATDDVSEQPELETLVGLLDDEYARDVLAATSRTPMTVNEISDESEASPSTLYRRVERLQRAGLLEEQTRPRRDGHHDTVYAATLRQLLITLEDGRFDCNVECDNEDAADRLQRLWSEF